jgi:hypothetical protein
VASLCGWDLDLGVEVLIIFTASREATGYNNEEYGRVFYYRQKKDLTKRTLC